MLSTTITHLTCIEHKTYTVDHTPGKYGSVEEIVHLLLQSPIQYNKKVY